MRHCQVFIIFEDDDNVYEWDNNNNVDDGKITVLKICKVTKNKGNYANNNDDETGITSHRCAFV